MPRTPPKSKALAAVAALAGLAGVASIAPEAKALQSTSFASSDITASPAAVAALRAKAANPADRMAQNRTFGERQWAEIKQGRPGDAKERVRRINPAIPSNVSRTYKQYNR
jgi:hypothetical protein